MSNEIAISVQNVSKSYRIWETPVARLTSPMLDAVGKLAGIEALKKSAARGYRDFQALKGISFDVKKGEAVGIIGRNGAGKSTLLQIIANTIRPSAGTMQAQGRVAALLELGSGFNGEFSGRENIWLTATIYGLPPAQIERLMPAIIAYADIGAFIDQPLRTYSTGMQMRVAFAVAAHVNADILIIDEALGVGDAHFQLKCAKTIDDFIAQGRTLLFVSHDVSSVKRLCQRAVLIEQGELVLDGEPNTVANFYSRLLAFPRPLAELRAEAKALRIDSKAVAAPAGPATTPVQGAPLSALPADNSLSGRLQVAQAALARLTSQTPWSLQMELISRGDRLEPKEAREQEFAYGNQHGHITDLHVRDESGAPALVFTTGEKMLVSFIAEARQEIQNPVYAVTVKSANGQDLYCTNTLFTGEHAPPIKAGQRHAVECELTLNLLAGEYFLSLGWVTFIGEQLEVVHRRYDAFKFAVLPVDRRVGIANLHSRISIRPEPA